MGDLHRTDTVLCTFTDINSFNPPMLRNRYYYYFHLQIWKPRLQVVKWSVQGCCHRKPPKTARLPAEPLLVSPKPHSRSVMSLEFCFPLLPPPLGQWLTLLHLCYCNGLLVGLLDFAFCTTSCIILLDWYSLRTAYAMSFLCSIFFYGSLWSRMYKITPMPVFFLTFLKSDPMFSILLYFLFLLSHCSLLWPDWSFHHPHKYVHSYLYDFIHCYWPKLHLSLSKYYGSRNLSYKFHLKVTFPSQRTLTFCVPLLYHIMPCIIEMCVTFLISLLTHQFISLWKVETVFLQTLHPLQWLFQCRARNMWSIISYRV